MPLAGFARRRALLRPAFHGLMRMLAGHVLHMLATVLRYGWYWLPFSLALLPKSGPPLTSWQQPMGTYISA